MGFAQPFLTDERRMPNPTLCLLGLGALLLAAPPAQADPRPILDVMPAYSRDYGFLADPAARTDPLDPLKYIPLDATGAAWLSLSGETRLRYEDFFRNPNFGTGGLTSDDYLFTRTTLGADLHLGARVRMFAQVNATTVNGKAGPHVATDASGVDWQQGFIEATLPMDGPSQTTLRLGRQEVIFGSQRLIALRDGPNVRQAFDGARLIVKSHGYEVSAFLFRPVRLGRGDFDDSADHGQSFYGLYATGPTGLAGASADAYILQLERRGAAFAQGTATERRTSLGGRLFGRTGSFDYNYEALYQFGTFGTGDIRAWTFASDSGYTLRTLPWAPRLGLKADIASGDKSLHDRTLNTFNALFPKGGYFTENGLVGPANIVDLQPGVTLNPTPAVNVIVAAVILWRQTTADAVYRQPNLPMPGTAGTPGHYTGTQYYVTPTWQMTPHLMLSATLVHFAVGQVIRHAHGGDSDYFGSWLTARF